MPDSDLIAPEGATPTLRGWPAKANWYETRA